MTKLDKMIFKVYSSKNDRPFVETFTSFAAAAGYASALTDITRSISVEFRLNDGLCSVSGCLYIYNGKTNARRVCNEYLIREVTKQMETK